MFYQKRIILAFSFLVYTLFIYNHLALYIDYLISDIPFYIMDNQIYFYEDDLDLLTTALVHFWFWFLLVVLFHFIIKTIGISVR